LSTVECRDVEANIPRRAYSLRPEKREAVCVALRTVLIHDQADRDAGSSDLLRYRDGHGDDWADIIDMLTMNPRSSAACCALAG
jgi:hypothetical protein